MSAATAITMTGPGAVSVNKASTNFTVALSPVGGTTSGNVTVTPASSLGGTITPATVTLSTAVQSATFTVTDAAEGSDTISVTNNGSLTNPGNLTLLVVGAAPSLAQLSGDAVNPASGTNLTVVPNTYAPIEVTITSLPGQVTAATLAVKQTAGTTATLMTKSALIVDPGTVQSNGTYTAIVLFHCVETDTNAMAPNSLPYSFSVQATVSAAGASHTVPAIKAGNWTSATGTPAG